MAEEQTTPEGEAPNAEPQAQDQNPESEAQTLGGQPEGEAGGDAAEGETPNGGDKDQDKEPEKEDEPEALKAEDYEFDLPEGVELDETISGEFREYLAANKVPKEEANKLMSLYLKSEAKKADEFKALQSDWLDQAKQDKEIGGSNYAQNLAVANAALNKVGTPELRALIDSSGFGNHPEVIRLFYKIGVATGEDRIINSGQQSNAATPKDPVNFYSKSNMK